MFDTSTKLDYYRDVQNLLALPNGSTIRYDYRENHITAGALAEAGADRMGKVLLAYVQHPAFRKGGDDPLGPLPYDGSLWIPTRIAELSHVRMKGNRTYLDLRLTGYPSNNIDALRRILKPLADAGEVPFAKWVATSEQNDDFELLHEGESSANWTAVIDRIGAAPSQFEGDSFWRISKIARGDDRIPIEPDLRDHIETEDGQQVVTRVKAIYPVFELEKIAIEVESRMPEAGAELAGEDRGAGRSVSFASSGGGPLKGFDKRSLRLRRYAQEWMETEVKGTDRTDAQTCHLTLTTAPAGPDDYPVGPELEILFEVAKKAGRAFWAIILALAAVAFGSGVVAADEIAWRLVFLVLAALLALLAIYLWTGTIRLPGIR